MQNLIRPQDESSQSTAQWITLVHVSLSGPALNQVIESFIFLRLSSFSVALHTAALRATQIPNALLPVRTAIEPWADGWSMRTPLLASICHRFTFLLNCSAHLQCALGTCGSAAIGGCQSKAAQYSYSSYWTLNCVQSAEESDRHRWHELCTRPNYPSNRPCHIEVVTLKSVHTTRLASIDSVDTDTLPLSPCSFFNLKYEYVLFFRTDQLPNCVNWNAEHVFQNTPSTAPHLSPSILLVYVLNNTWGPPRGGGQGGHGPPQRMEWGGAIMHLAPPPNFLGK